MQAAESLGDTKDVVVSVKADSEGDVEMSHTDELTKGANDAAKEEPANDDVKQEPSKDNVKHAQTNGAAKEESTKDKEETANGAAKDDSTKDETANDRAGKDTAKPPKQRPRLSPEDGLALFDLALVEQSVAQLTSDLPASQSTLADIDAATRDLAHSTRVFAFLATWGKGAQRRAQKLLYSARLAGERAGFGRSLEAKLQRRREEQEQVERQRAEHVEQWHRQQGEAEARRRMEADRRRREEGEAEARILRETEERNAAIREQMAADASRAADAPAKPRRPAAKKQQQQRGRRDDGFIEDSEDLEYGEEVPVRGDHDDGDNDDDGDGVDGKAGPKMRTKKKKRLARGTRVLSKEV
ncbi:hypothetical protein IWW50_005363, partial [Coemansia erecta]